MGSKIELAQKIMQIEVNENSMHANQIRCVASNVYS